MVAVVVGPRASAGGEGGDSSVGASGCKAGRSDDVVDRAVLGVRMTGSSCLDGTRLMRAFHDCLQGGGEEASCRSSGPQVQPDTARIGEEFASSAAEPLAVSTEAEL